MTQSANLFSGLPSNLPEELIDKLVDAPDIRIERIVSTGHASPLEFWYDQSESEWVVVLRGEAVLAFEDETRMMKPGDYVLIPVIPIRDIITLMFRLILGKQDNSGL